VKPIIDQIDQVLAKHYGFTDEELDFIINYDTCLQAGRSSTAWAGWRMAGRKHNYDQ